MKPKQLPHIIFSYNTNQIYSIQPQNRNRTDTGAHTIVHYMVHSILLKNTHARTHTHTHTPV